MVGIYVCIILCSHDIHMHSFSNSMGEPFLQSNIPLLVKRTCRHRVLSILKYWHVETSFPLKINMEHHFAGCNMDLFWKLLVLPGVLVVHGWMLFSGFVGMVWFVLGTLLRGDQDSPLNL